MLVEQAGWVVPVRVSKSWLRKAGPRKGAGPSKFRAIRNTVDGEAFDSKLEAKRWSILKTLVMAGHVTDLKRQVSYDLTVNGLLICRYVADFTYLLHGVPVVNDAKGVRTREYRIKKKLMQACHGITILETS